MCRQKFRNWCLQHTQKKIGTQACSPQGNITFSLNYTLQSFGNWRYQLLQFCKWNFCPYKYFCIQDLGCSTVCSHCCLILLFIMHHTFWIEDRSGLQAGQSSTHTLCLRSNAFVTCPEWGLALSCWVLGKSRRLEGSICLSKILT